MNEMIFKSIKPKAFFFLRLIKSIQVSMIRKKEWKIFNMKNEKGTSL